jgi:hypothetical protein
MPQTAFFAPPTGVANVSGLNAKVVLALRVGNRQEHVVVFPVTPNQVTFYNTARTTVTQTVGGVFIDDFGAGYSVLTIQGDSGYWNSMRGSLDNSMGLDGTTFKDALYRYFYQLYFQLERSNLAPNPAVNLHFFDTYSGRHYIVKPYQDFQFSQSSTSPMVWEYTLSFVVLADIQAASQYGKTVRS